MNSLRTYSIETQAAIRPFGAHMSAPFVHAGRSEVGSVRGASKPFQGWQAIVAIALLAEETLAKEANR